MSYCAPSKTNTKRYSCLTDDMLLKMGDKLNSQGTKINLKTNKYKLWGQIRNTMADNCVGETCWVKKLLPDSQQIIQERFRPEMPKEWVKNPKTWLMTSNIFKVMIQYEKVFPDFLFIGPVPSDCPTGIMCELSNFSLIDAKKKGVNKIGIIFNLDAHDEPGSHWVASYVSLPEKSVEYFDSYGEPPIPSIEQFLQNLTEDGNKNNLGLKYKFHKKRFQYGNSECGVFSMVYILERLHGVSFEKLQTKKINDKQMLAIRKIFFRPSE